MNIWWGRRTRPGVIYILLLLFVTAAAVNTGNNTLYLTSSLLMALLVVSGLYSTYNIHAVQLARVTAGDLFSSHPGEVRILLSNRSRGLPVQGLLVEGRPAPIIPAGSTAWMILDVTFPTRGRIDSFRTRVTTTFPFGFFTREKILEIPADLIVYPGPRPTPDCHALTYREGEDSAGSRAVTGERSFSSIKPFRPGDDPRSIHWKKSAQMESWVAKEFKFERSGNTIYRVPGDIQADKLERLLSTLTFCILRDLRAGTPAGLQDGDLLIPPATGASHRARLLSHLALL